MRHCIVSLIETNIQAVSPSTLAITKIKVYMGSVASRQLTPPKSFMFRDRIKALRLAVNQFIGVRIPVSEPSYE